MIVLTDTATDKVRSLMEQEGVDDLALRVAVRPGGCSGFSYEMFFDTDVAEDDKTLDYSGVKVVVDPSSASLLEGATLDYKEGVQPRVSAKSTAGRAFQDGRLLETGRPALRVS